MITKDNFFECSYGAFKLLPGTWATKARESVTIRCETDPVTGWDYVAEKSQNPVRLGNHTWLPNFVSYSCKWGSLSAYWLSEDGQWLLRLSDHWSEGPAGVKAIGNIRQCYWRLVPGDRPRKDARYWLGIVRLSDLRER